jgi:hypothetical protein
LALPVLVDGSLGRTIWSLVPVLKLLTTGEKVFEPHEQETEPVLMVPT